MHTSVFKIPSGRRFGSIAIYAHAHQYAQNTVRQTVWKHCCLNTCTPACSKYRQADVLETSLYKQMHTSMFKIPSGRRFGDLALIFGLSLRAQNAVRQVFYVKNLPLRGVRSWPRGPPSPGCTHYPNHKICPVRSFSGTSPCIFRPASGIGFRPATPAGFISPKSLSRVLEFLFYMWCRSFR